MSIFEEFMKFCPRCGDRLKKQSPPAECSNCGWRENQELEDEE